MSTVILIGFLGGLIAGVSPCVLPILPALFFAAGTGPQSAGGERQHRHIRRPLMIVAGLVLSFSLFTLIGSLLLSALGLPQGLFRWVGLVVLTLIGIGLMFPAVNAIISRPFARLRLAGRRPSGGNGFMLGLGLGALYVPCAGPVLAAIAIAGSTGEIDTRIITITVAFAIGVAIPLSLFALAGNNIGARMASYRRRARRFRVAGGAVMIVLAVALAFNLTDALQRAVPNYTQDLQARVENIGPILAPAAPVTVVPATGAAGASTDNAPAPGAASPGAPAFGALTTGAAAAGAPATGAAAAGAPASGAPAAGAPATGAPASGAPATHASAAGGASVTPDPNATLKSCTPASLSLADCGPAPAFENISRWFNTTADKPLTVAGLKGSVVLVTFWTYSCINCQRALPHVQSWYTAYANKGLQVVGIHTPEFAFEREVGNVKQGIADQHLSFPVAMDNSSSTWRNYQNSYWPAQYLIDAAGNVRHIKYGEGDYAASEALIRQLLTEEHPGIELPATVEANPVG